MGRKARNKRDARAVEKPRSVAAINTSWLSWIIALALITVTAFVYQSVTRSQFISLDDPQYVAANPFVAAGITADGVAWAMRTLYAANWHPLTWISHMLDVELFDMDAGAHHTTNLLLHIASSVLLFVTIYRMTQARWRSALVAALFAIHPLHVESVAWVAERKDVLSTFFWVLAIFCHVRFTERPTLGRKLAVVVILILGLMSKPMLVTLPFTLLLLDYWPLRRIDTDKVTSLRAWWPLVREKLPMFALVVASSAITIIAQRGGGAVIALERLPLGARVGNACVAYLEYIRDAIWPTKLAVFYPFPKYPLTIMVVSAVLLIAITLAVIKLRSRFPYLPVGWAWYLGTLVPVIGIVQVGAQGRADRYTYVPLIGLFIIAAWGFNDLSKRLRLPDVVLPVLAAASLAACAVLTERQAKYWQNNLLLWSHAVDVTHDNYRAEDRLGVALTDLGRTDDGVEHYLAAIRIWPGYPEAHNNLGAARMDQQRYADAVREFATATHARPGSSTFRYNLAVALDADGRRPAAIAVLDTALRSDPNNAQLKNAWETLGGGARK